MIANRRQAGFTLVELLVAMALIIFMLSIMSQAFVIATTCLQGIKGVGEILDRARPVLNIMQRDLGAYHFDGNRRLSEADFWMNGPPKAGYFMIWQDQAYTATEGSVDGVTYNRSAVDAKPALNANHMLAFTVRQAGNNPEDFFTSSFPTKVPTGKLVTYQAGLGPIFSNNASTQTNYPLMVPLNPMRFDFTQGMVHSQWAEVAYFLRLNGNSANGTTLCDLYRQVKLVLPATDDANKWSAANAVSYNARHKGDLYEFSWRSEKGDIRFNSPMDLTVPWKRQGDRISSHLGLPSGASMFTSYESTTYVAGQKHPGSYTDLLMPDVISFDVRILSDDKLDFLPLRSILGNAPYNPSPNTGYQTTPAGRFVFDTWTTDSPGAPLPTYDLGDDSSGNWQPSSGTGNNRIPVWGKGKGLRINAIQVSLRIWDAKSGKAREFKLIQRL